MTTGRKLFSWQSKVLLLGLAGLLLLALFGYRVEARKLPEVTESVQNRPIVTLGDLNKAFVDLAAMVKPAVVTVSTERIHTYQSSPFGNPFSNDPLFDFFFGPRGQRQQPQEREYKQRGLGSGIIVSDDGYVLTNNHVVDQADTIFVHTADGVSHDARVIGVDPKTDVAVLKIDSRDLDYIKIGDSDKLQVGEIVLAIGSPMSENLAQTVTQGIVSATGRSNVGLADYEDFIQTDAAINPGNSGGPLVNLNGELVGINTAIASRSGGFQGIGFAVPSNMAMRVMNSLISNGRVVRGWLGVSIQNVSETMVNAMGLKDMEGALVGDVLPDSPAGTAGLEAGDVIVGVDGQRVGNTAQLRNLIAGTAPGTDVTLQVVRNSKPLKVTATLAELPGDEGAVVSDRGLEDILGFSYKTVDRDLARRFDIDAVQTGAVVTSIDQSSAAYAAGLREGDLIQSAERSRVRTGEDLVRILSSKREGDTVLLRILRTGGGFFVAFKL